MKFRRRILNAILRFEHWAFDEGIPEHWEKVDHVFILEELLEVGLGQAKLYLADRDYYLPTLQDIFDFLDGDETDKEHYTKGSDYYDCDDFSFRLMGQFQVKPWSAVPLAIVWSGVHAYNLIIVTQDGVFLIEPQTDRVFRPTVNGKLTYDSELIII